MAAFWRAEGSQNGIPTPTSRTLQARAESSSEAAALHGQKALTPIIAGTISGTCIAVAWLVALIVILLKRRRRKKRYKKVGQADKAAEERRTAEFIVPPDPAVLEGSYKPGERIILEEKRRWWKGRRRANSNSGSKEKGKEKGKERATAPRRPRVGHAPRPKPRNERADGQASRSGYTRNGEASIPEEEMEYSPHPPFHRLSTIMSVADPQRSLDRIPPPVPPKDDIAGHEDFRDIDFAASDDHPQMLAPADPSHARAHSYPPSRV